VIEDSAFRQWLTTQEGLVEFNIYYSRFFSDQFEIVVYGCKIITFGLAINFYQFQIIFLDTFKHGFSISS